MWLTARDLLISINVYEHNDVESSDDPFR